MLGRRPLPRRAPSSRPWPRPSGISALTTRIRTSANHDVVIQNGTAEDALDALAKQHATEVARLKACIAELEVRLQAAPAITRTTTQSLPQESSAQPLESLDSLGPTRVEIVAEGPPLCGVSLVALQRIWDHFIPSIAQTLGKPREQVTITELVNHWVKPATSAASCRLAELRGAASGLRDSDVGAPQYFVSHAWENTFWLLLTTVRSFLRDSDPSTTRVWVDFLAVNQDIDNPQSSTDVSAFSRAIKAAKHGTIVVMDAVKCLPATRIWCVFEWDHTYRIHGPDGLHMPLTSQLALQVVGSLDVQQAQATRQEDLRMILSDLQREHGSTELFNTKLKLRIALQPVSHRVDLAMLTKRAGDADQWCMDEVLAWLGSPVESSRALCIVGAAGTGKSTCSAMLVTHPATADAISAYHFLKYNDQRRLDMVRLVQSMAFQLAGRYPAMREYYMRLTTEQLTQPMDLESTFNLLLHTPLHDEAMAGEKVVLLLDALDEADPQQQTICGNKALLLLKNNLLTLPPNVRFILTTRPDAVSGCVLPSLKESLPGLILIDPHRLNTQGCGVYSEREGGGGAVMLIDTLLNEVPRQAMEGTGTSLDMNKRDLETLYDLYARMFESLWLRCSASEAEDVRQLLQVLMAAQEPPSMLLLTQLGLTHALRLLPPVLFYEAEHHVFTLHKSLADYLCGSSSLASARQAIDVKAGHLLLGTHLAETSTTIEAESSHYTMKHLIKHLSSASDLPAAAEALDRILVDFDFIEAVFAHGSGHRLIRDLGQAVEHTPLSLDALRWLTTCQHEMNEQGASAVGLALKYAPPVSPVNLAACNHLRSLPSTSHLIKRFGQWPEHQVVLQGHSQWVSAVVLSHDGRAIISGSDDKTLRVWDAASGQCRAILKGHTWHVKSVALSNNSLVMVSGGGDKTVRVWDAASGQCRAVLQGHTEWVTAVAISRDGGTIVSGSDDKTLRVWRIIAGQLQCTAVLEGHHNTVSSVSMSPDGATIASSSDDMSIRLWDTATGQCRAVLKGHNGPVNSVALGVHGKLVSGSDDRTVRVWDYNKGHCVGILKGHTSYVYSVALSADGSTIVSGSDDKTVRVWRAPAAEPAGSPPKCVAVLKGHTEWVRGVAVSADGSTVISGSRDETLRVWAFEPGGSA